MSPQTPPPVPTSLPLDYYAADPAFRRLMARMLPETLHDWAEPQFARMGKRAAIEVDPLAIAADRTPPLHRPYDPLGNRIDEIVYHPSYPEMVRIAYGSGLVSHGYDAELARTFGRVPHVLTFGLGYLFAQAETGLYCPVCLTAGTARLVAKFADPALQRRYLPRLTASDPEELWQGAMFLTEKEGGSDVGQTSLKAVPEGDTWRLWGEKWFCSNADAGVMMVLARPEGAAPGTRGLGLFLVPRTLEDGTRNPIRINRLKDKLGVRSMASAELDFQGAVAYAVGDLSKGFHYMTEMLNLSRVFNSVASVAVSRRALFEAIRYIRDRVAFGKAVDQHALAREILAGMLVEQEAATRLVFQTIHHLDQVDAGHERTDGPLLRILTPMIKAHTGKLAVSHASEAMELHGGNGYIEDFVTARLLRDAQVLPIWEGTTNILILDMLRAILKERAHEALLSACARRLEALKDARLRDWARPVEAAVLALSAEVSSWDGLEPARRELAAKRFFEEAIAVTEAALLFEAAQEGLDAGSAREALVARLYALKAFGPRRAAMEALSDAYEALVDPAGTAPLPAFMEPLTRA
jgi:alkylation response protein AidB-like acyl-CoA dehydrogenase